MCAKFRLNRWGKKCLGLGGRLTKKGKLKSDESQNGVTSLYMYISGRYFIFILRLGSATCVLNFV